MRPSYPKRKPPAGKPPASADSEGWLNGSAAIVVLSLAAFSISGYLLWGSLSGEGLPGCGPNSGCDAVLSSRWASWLGIPVSLLAMAIYAGVIGGVVSLPRLQRADRRGLLKAALAAAGVAVVVAALWFIALQLLVIQAICPFCMAAHACGLVVGALLLRGVRARPELQRERQPEALPISRWRWGFLTAGAVGSGLLVIGQVLYQPPSFEVAGISGTSIVAGDAGSRDWVLPEGEVPEVTTRSDVAVDVAPGPERRLLSVHDGLFEFDLNGVPVIGSPAAPTVVLHFFDYSCSHCRALHPLLAEAHHVLGDRLALVSVPIPLEPDCNPVMKRRIAEHTNACLYARIGLAVWLADGARLAEYDDWFFAFGQPPRPEVARGEAGRLVGTNALAEAMRDPWIDAYLAEGIRLYHTNYLRYGKSVLPLMMVDTNLVSGVLRTTNQLYQVLGIQPVSGIAH